MEAIFLYSPMLLILLSLDQKTKYFTKKKTIDEKPVKTDNKSVEGSIVYKTKTGNTHLIITYNDPDQDNIENKDH